MRSPLAPGSPRDAKRYRRWISSFGSYRNGVTASSIDNWIGLFRERQTDSDIAARILDAVDYYGQSQIYAAYRQSLRALGGWHREPEQRKGNWWFAAMSGSAGESGDSMLYNFRVANGLDAKKLNKLFVSRSDLFRHSMSEDDTVVLLDDFSGTGTQVCAAWNDPETSFGSLLAGAGKVYLILVAASKAARKRISDETQMRLVTAHELREGDNVFSEHCKHFTHTDRTRLLHYCKIADSRKPKGFGDCGFVVVFQHRSPNNSIPILHKDHENWTGLFPRHD